VLVDLYCGAGGATKGYQQAGFFVIGVDINPQPNYCGDAFIQMDALEFMARLATTGLIFLYEHETSLGHDVEFRLDDIAAFHGSPPCQFHSGMTNCRPGLKDEYTDLISETRDFFEWFGIPWVIENVMGSPLRPDLLLCGQMFGRELYRHRLFESNVPLNPPTQLVPARYPHRECGWGHPLPASKAGHWTPGTIMSVAGHMAPVALARKIMEIDWTNREELAESIPPYYSEHVGVDLLSHIYGIDFRKQLQIPPGLQWEVAAR
jgi:DNA (cytosine-5)-methyltransferase 1